jgi:hypothetical protein
MKKYLIVETFPNSPHLETSVEIALKLKKNNKVFFFWCGYDLEWKDWELPLLKKILFCSFDRKVYKTIDFLKKNDIIVIPKFNLSFKQNKIISNSIKSFKNYNKIKNYKYKKNIPIGLAAFSSLVSKNHTDDIKQFINEIKPALKTGCTVFERSLKVIQDINPDTVITFNNRFIISKPIIEAAKICKKKVLIHERGSDLSKYEIYNGDIFDYNYLHKKINNHWACEKSLKKKICISNKYFNLIKRKKFFYNRGFNFESSSLNKIKLPENKKIITFLCSTDYEYVSVSSKINNFYLNKIWSNQINVIKTVIQLIENEKDTILYIKAHPNFSTKQSQEDELIKLQAHNVIYLSNNEHVDSLYLIKKSSIIITFGSSLELISLHFNKNVISFFKSFYYKFNLVTYPENKKILKKILKKKIVNMTNYKILKLNKIAYYLMTFGIKYKYYKPISFSRGTFKNTSINEYSFLLNFLSRIIFSKYLKNI